MQLATRPIAMAPFSENNRFGCSRTYMVDSRNVPDMFILRGSMGLGLDPRISTVATR
jgi:hypothetical protein